MRRTMVYLLLVLAPFVGMVLPLALALSDGTRAAKPTKAAAGIDAADELQGFLIPVMESVEKLVAVVGQDPKDVAAVRQTVRSLSKSLEKSLDFEDMETGPVSASAPPLSSEKHGALLLRLRAFLEGLGVDVMKQVDDSVTRLNKESLEIEP